MARIARRFVLTLLVTLAAVYLADVAVFYVRKSPTSTVTVHPYTAIPHKDKREELMFGDPYDETCANSLLPHQHMPPCWYLRRHTEKRTDV